MSAAPERIHPDLRAVAEAVEVLSPVGYAVLGEARTVPGPPGSPPPMLAALERELYARLYCRASLHAPPASAPAALRDHVAALSGANTGSGAWEAGWRVAAVEADGALGVARGTVTFYPPAGEVRVDGGRPRVGAPCRVRVPKEQRALVPGFYMAVGDRPAGGGDPRGAPLVRVYWHLTAEAPGAYLRAATARLNGAGIPFLTKVLSDPLHYGRADAGVLYLARADFGRARRAIADVYRDVRGGLRAEVPLFAKRLAEGLGLAEDPGDGRSFGQSRCAAAAQGLWSAHLAGAADAEARLRHVADAFRQAGIDPARPHLPPGAPDPYHLPPHRPAARAAAV